MGKSSYRRSLWICRWALMEYFLQLLNLSMRSPIGSIHARTRYRRSNASYKEAYMELAFLINP
jgi:hypothetical protein